jgi:hypothetical protein
MKILTILTLLFGWACAYGQEIAPAGKCADLVNFAMPGAEMTITKAEEIPAAPHLTQFPWP